MIRHRNLGCDYAAVKRCGRFDYIAYGMVDSTLGHEVFVKSSYPRVICETTLKKIGEMFSEDSIVTIFKLGSRNSMYRNKASKLTQVGSFTTPTKDNVKAHKARKFRMP